MRISANAIVLSLLLGCSAPALAQVQATLLPNGQQTFLDQNGQPLASGTVGFYIPNTLTPKTTWIDPLQATPNSNPVVLNAAGRATIYGLGQYREIVKDLFGNTVWDQLTMGPGNSSVGSLIVGPSVVTVVPQVLNFVTPQGMGALCNGATDDSAALLAADGTGYGTSFQLPGTCLISSSITFNNAVTFFPGAKIKPSSNLVTVTFLGPVNAGASQICDVSAGGICNLSKIPGGAGYVEWWGAVGGLTDYTSTNVTANTAAWTGALAGSPPWLYATNKCYSVSGLVLDGSLPRTIVGDNEVNCGLVGVGLPYVYASHNPPQVSFTGSISATTLSVSAISAGLLKPGQFIMDGTGDLTPYTIITAQLSGLANSTGTYSVDRSQSVSAEAMTVENPCETRNFVVQDGAAGTASAPQRFLNFTITAATDTAAAVGVCTNDSVQGDPEPNWNITAENSAFGFGTVSNAAGAYAGWIWGWANSNVMINDRYDGDFYGEGYIFPPIEVGSWLAIQKISHFGGQWSCGTNTHGFFVYQDEQKSSGNFSLGNISYQGSPTFEFCGDIMKLDATGQIFDIPWFERIGAGDLMFEDDPSYSSWTTPQGGFAVGPIPELIEKLNFRSTVADVNVNYSSAGNCVLQTSGAGSPEGSVVAGIGSTYYNTTGGSGTTLYVKEAGNNTCTGDTGWVAK